MLARLRFESRFLWNEIMSSAQELKAPPVSHRVSHSVLDPWIGPKLKALYPRLRIPSWFPPEGIILVGHVSAILGAVGFAYSTQTWWGGLLAAAGVIGNHTADCLDGTHARQTGQCRNGGELLDHFTDPLSFTYWLVGIGVAIGRLDLALVAVICLMGIAVLTNIKAKLLGEFTLARFGPTEFKTLLVCLGVGLATLTVIPSIGISASDAALMAYFALIATGLIQLPIQLAQAVAEVNRSGAAPDTSEWVSTGVGQVSRVA